MHIMTAEGWKQLAPRISKPANGILQPITKQDAEKETMARANAYAKAVDRYVKGNLGLERIHDAWAEEMTGAFGEIIR